MTRSTSTVLVGLGLAVAIAAASLPASAATAGVSPDSTAEAGSNELLSIRADGSPTRQGSQLPAVSGDGAWVTFTSYAIGLVEGETIRGAEVYRLSRVTGDVELVSRSLSGGGGNDGSFESQVSADGRFVAFTSLASNLVAGDRRDGLPEVYVRDLESATTTVVARGRRGGAANDYSELGGISADGRFVLFSSRASNLVPADRNGTSDVFLLDREAGTTTLISRGIDGKPARGGASLANAISADGRLIAYQSAARNIVADDTNGYVDVFVRDTVTGETTLVSRAADGSDANGISQSADISRDGTHVVYESSARNIVPGDTNSDVDVFLHDLATGDTTLVSRSSGGDPANGDSIQAAVSDGGTAVTFRSAAENLVPGDDNGVDDVFVVQVETGKTTWVSRRDDGAPNTSTSREPAITADGRTVVFVAGDRLVDEDRNKVTDIYRWSMA